MKFSILVTLDAGDALYLPPGWFHHVTSESHSPRLAARTARRLSGERGLRVARARLARGASVARARLARGASMAVRAASVARA